MRSSASLLPDISIIVPVLHEGEQILTLLTSLANNSAGINYEVIVVDGDPYGSTVRLVPETSQLITQIAAPGRGSQMNAGAKVAASEILMFLHADTQLPQAALSQVWQLLQHHPEYAGGAFNLGIRSSRWLLQLVAKGASWRSRLTRMPYGDQAIFLRRSVFTAVGGYPEEPLMEDVALMRRVKQHQQQIYIFSDRVLVSPRRWEYEGVLYCTLRNWTLLSLYYLGVSPQWLVKWYQPIKANKSG